jgi:hypothetical protein
MPMDDTDRRLVKGLIWVLVFGALGYYVPGFGYKQRQMEATQARERLKNSAVKYGKFYPDIHPAHYGDTSATPVFEPPGTPLADLRSSFSRNNYDVQQLIEMTEKASRMSFAEWTLVPEKDVRNPGVYFFYMWQLKKNRLANALNEAKVECLDPDIGFGRYKGEVFKDVNLAEEKLRELFIAEKLIELCIAAKQRQEQFEKDNSLKTEAFMRIVAVEPQESVPTGPSALVVNPRYNPEERNPSSERFRKYLVKPYKPFIQEYPVQLTLQCDVNTYMRFLHSVRAPGQFLVIRTLEIVSPYLEESKSDKTELRDFRVDPNDPEKYLRLNDEHILVRMSAAGMDFFDPVKHPRGIYDRNLKDVRPTTTGKKPRVLPSGG